MLEYAYSIPNVLYISKISDKKVEYIIHEILKAIYSIYTFSVTIYFCPILHPFILLTYITYIVIYKIKFLYNSPSPLPTFCIYNIKHQFPSLLSFSPSQPLCTQPPNYKENKGIQILIYSKTWHARVHPVYTRLSVIS